MEELRVGIVGSRRRSSLSDRQIVFSLIERIIAENPEKKVVIVSGACRTSADRFARDYCDMNQVEIKEHPPKTWTNMTKWEFTQEAFGRNRLIAEDSHIGYALVSPDRLGGTENTISHYHDLMKKVFLVDGIGGTYLEEDGTKDTDEVGITPA